MSNIGGVGGNKPVSGFSLPSLKEVGSKIVEGFKAIGSKIAEFGAAVSETFSNIGRAIAGAGNNAHPAGATAPVLQGRTFSSDEKRGHMDQALSSNFFKTMGDSTTSALSAKSFTDIAAAVLETPASVAAMKAYGVTLDEAVAISMYTSQAFNDINAGIRGNLGKPEIDALATAFTSGLAKLPSFDGNSVTGPDGNTYHQCFRGARLPNDVAQNYMIGNQVADPGIMSSTYNKAEAFGDRINFDMVLLLKPGSEGKDISMFSDKPTECEVAFPPNVGFTVVDRRLDSGGRIPPEMEKTMHPKLDDFGRPVLGACNIVMIET